MLSGTGDGREMLVVMIPKEGRGLSARHPRHGDSRWTAVYWQQLQSPPPGAVSLTEGKGCYGHSSTGDHEAQLEKTIAKGNRLPGHSETSKSAFNYI